MTANEPAFPHCVNELTAPDANGVQQMDERYYSGLTKRELFAAMAMQGLSAGVYGECESISIQRIHRLGEVAVQLADTLVEKLRARGLAELAK